MAQMTYIIDLNLIKMIENEKKSILLLLALIGILKCMISSITKVLYVSILNKYIMQLLCLFLCLYRENVG